MCVQILGIKLAFTSPEWGKAHHLVSEPTFEAATSKTGIGNATVSNAKQYTIHDLMTVLKHFRSTIVIFMYLGLLPTIKDAFNLKKWKNLCFKGPYKLSLLSNRIKKLVSLHKNIRERNVKYSRNQFILLYTRCFKYDRDKLWLVYTQSVPIIFEPPCIWNMHQEIYRRFCAELANLLDTRFHIQTNAREWVTQEAATQCTNREKSVTNLSRKERKAQANM